MAGERGLAEQVRTGLEPQPMQSKMQEVPVLRVIQGKNPLDQLFHGRKVREHIREFGALFALIFAVISAFVFYRHGSDTKALTYLGIGSVVLLLGARAPAVLHPVWSGWMKFAEKLSVVTTFAILMVAWSLLVVPMALLLRVLRVKVMNMDYRLPVDSYWETRAERLHDFKLLERQF